MITPLLWVTLNGQILTPLGYFADVIGVGYERYEKHWVCHIASRRDCDDNSEECATSALGFRMIYNSF